MNRGTSRQWELGEHASPVELIDVYPSKKKDLPSRVWTPQELEDLPLEELGKLAQVSKPFSIESAAYHEAGHALVAHMMGWDLKSVLVNDERNHTNPNCAEGVCNYTVPRDRADEDAMMVLMAGAVEYQFLVRERSHRFLETHESFNSGWIQLST